MATKVGNDVIPDPAPPDSEISQTTVPGAEPTVSPDVLPPAPVTGPQITGSRV